MAMDVTKNASNNIAMRWSVYRPAPTSVARLKTTKYLGSVRARKMDIATNIPLEPRSHWLIGTLVHILDKTTLLVARHVKTNASSQLEDLGKRLM